ncbi:MAG: helix-turn-helix domain-containing protein [Defluviitaleaceae bacterium]|nr:helix-turn-helix domain-containing protein [Defluviitaleaceae bacterium]
MEKFYTVDDIATMTMFTTRTIRNYLKDGQLTGRKIGGQWRFTEDDIGKFMNQGGVNDKIKSEKKQDVLDFLEGIFTEYSGEIQTCTIIDIYKPIEAVKTIKDELIMLPGTMAKSDNAHSNRMSYGYNEKEGCARFILFGSPRYIGEAMKILEKKQGD